MAGPVRSPPPTNSLSFTRQQPPRGGGPLHRACPAFTPRRPPFPRAQYAFIKRVSETAFEDETFAVIELRADDNVGLLVGRACKELDWGAPSRMRLFLAAAGGAEEPPPDALVAAAADPAKRLGVGLPLARAGITPGCWLLARVPPPAAAAPGAFCCGMPN